MFYIRTELFELFNRIQSILIELKTFQVPATNLIIIIIIISRSHIPSHIPSHSHSHSSELCAPFKSCNLPPLNFSAISAVLAVFGFIYNASNQFGLYLFCLAFQKLINQSCTVRARAATNTHKHTDTVTLTLIHSRIHSVTHSLAGRSVNIIKQIKRNLLLFIPTLRKRTMPSPSPRPLRCHPLPLPATPAPLSQPELTTSSGEVRRLPSIAIKY